MRHVVIMGVSGCGKSTLAEAFAQASDYAYFDADDFHPKANVDKMRSGIALTDADRTPWLKALNQHLAQAHQPIVLACSALKNSYRMAIAQDLSIRWVYLQGSEQEIAARLRQRAGHYMPASLLQSQLHTLEAPNSKEALIIPISLSTAAAVQLIKENLCV